MPFIAETCYTIGTLIHRRNDDAERENELVQDLTKVNYLSTLANGFPPDGAGGGQANPFFNGLGGQGQDPFGLDGFNNLGGLNGFNNPGGLDGFNNLGGLDGYNNPGGLGGFPTGLNNGGTGLYDGPYNEANALGNLGQLSPFNGF